MALKDIWIDRVDDVDDASAEDINKVAHAVIENEDVISETTKNVVQNTEKINNIRHDYPLFSNAIKGSASGEMVSLNDVSPIQHEMSVSVRGKNLVKIKAFGKNLIDIHNRTKGTTPNGANTLQRKLETDKYYVGLTANNYCYDYNVNLAEYVEGVWRISNKSSGYGVAFPVEAKPNTSYYLTGVNGYVAVGFYDKDGNFIKYFAYVEDGASSFLTPANCAFITVCLAPTSINTIVEYSNVQLEVGTAATEYEPYKEPVTYAQGEPINSIYPCTTLMTDTAGAVMDVTYNRDANKVVNELETRIAALEAAILN